MKTSLITRTAAILLLLTSGAAFSGETGFPWTAPDTGPRGVPSSLHWTALIATGHVSGPASVSQSKSSSSSQDQLSAAEPHWTSKIGTGHAPESSGRLRAISAGGPGARGDAAGAQ